jgi:alpha-L-rhamnosidase
MDTAGFLSKWLQDLKADQREDGLVPHIIPWLPNYPVFRLLGPGGSAGWGDACVLVPWQLYLSYGDRRILEVMYPVMQRWLEFIDSRASNFIWKRGMHWGDWLEPGRKEYRYFLPWAKKGHVATPFWAHSAEITAKIAAILGKQDEAEKYHALSETVKQAYVRKFVRRDGRIKPHSQGAYVLALAFDMVPNDLAPKLAAHLADLVRRNGNHLDTGFLSTPHLCDVLCRYGYEELAFALLLQDSCPSWLYQVKQGATTIWESWETLGPDGSLRKGQSFNHYAFGAIGAWLYGYIAGIRPHEGRPGYKHTLLAPHPGGDIRSARATYQSPFGKIGIKWERDDHWMQVEVCVPPNTSATLQLPGAQKEAIEEAGTSADSVEGVAEICGENGGIRLSIGSGQYRFRYSTA